MDTALLESLRLQLTDRGGRLRRAIAEMGEAPDLVRLLHDVDSALKRMDRGAYGTCAVCHTDVADEDLAAHPSTPWCFCNLSVEEQRVLEHDLDLAARLQWSLLPPVDLALDGWETHYRYLPAGPVSGDYLDLVPRSGDGGLFVLLGDVSGKGVAASMFMARLNALFRTLVHTGQAVGEMMAQAHQLFASSTVSTHYATLVCGRAASDGSLEIANAGHCRPVVLSRGKVRLLEATGFPVGLVAAGTTTTTIALGRGDVLFLYTDGLSEARDEGGDELGPDRISAAVERAAGLSARAVVATVLQELQSFQGKAARTDDLTVMAVARTA